MGVSVVYGVFGKLIFAFPIDLHEAVSCTSPLFLPSVGAIIGLATRSLELLQFHPDSPLMLPIMTHVRCSKISAVLQYANVTATLT